MTFTLINEGPIYNQQFKAIGGCLPTEGYITLRELIRCCESKRKIRKSHSIASISIGPMCLKLKPPSLYTGASYWCIADQHILAVKCRIRMTIRDKSRMGHITIPGHNK
jgi:hypothetical protein